VSRGSTVEQQMSFERHNPHHPTGNSASETLVLMIAPPFVRMTAAFLSEFHPGVLILEQISTNTPPPNSLDGQPPPSGGNVNLSFRVFLALSSWTGCVGFSQSSPWPRSFCIRRIVIPLILRHYFFFGFYEDRLTSTISSPRAVFPYIDPYSFSFSI